MKSSVFFAGLLFCLLGLHCPDTAGGNQSTPAGTGGTNPRKDLIQVPIVIDTAWLTKTSMANIPGSRLGKPEPACIAAGGPLYRGSQAGGDFQFGLPHIARNMLGDETAEYKSWRFTNLLEHQKLTLKSDLKPDVWKLLKDEAFSEIESFPTPGMEKAKDWTLVECEGAPTLCARFACYGVKYTWEAGKTLAEKKQSWGIAAINGAHFYTARGFAFWGKPTEVTPNPGDSIILEATERIPRAAVATVASTYGGGGNEFYFPIVIPAGDITRGWSARYTGDAGHSHSLEKIETSNRSHLLEIRIYREHGVPHNPAVSGDFEGRIIACAKEDPCLSEAVQSADSELFQIVEAVKKIPPEWVEGYRFKFVTSKGH